MLRVTATSLQTRIRRVFIRAFLPIVWRRSKQRTAEAMFEFSSTEVDSAWQNLHALQHVTDVKIRAKMFQHVLEEVHHGALFRKLGEAYAGGLLPLAMDERQPLWKELPEPLALREFYTYEHVAEVGVRDEFATYADASPYPDIRDTFQRLRRDEEGHARYTAEVCAQLAQSPGARFWGEAKVKLVRFYQAWGRLGALLALVPSTLLLSAIYFLFGPFGALLKKPPEPK